MSAAELVGSAAAGLEAVAERIRASVRPAESMAEVRANNTVYNIAEVVDELARAMKRLKCVMDAVGGSKGSVAAACTSWRVYAPNGGVAAVRVKPETVIRFADGRLVFHHDHVRMEVEGTRVKLCKWSYCKEFDAADRKAVIEELPQIIYLLRFVSNAARKSLDAITLCARKEAPECARLY